jgi:large repetitive protein
MAFDHETAPKGAMKSGAAKSAAADKAAPMQLAQVAGAIQNAATGGTRVVPAANGVVRLPAGTSLDNIHADGRDLIIQLPDGTQILVPNGAVTVPQIVIGDTAVPAANVLALIQGNEVQPAAGPPGSSGGNFAVPLGDIGDGIGIGDLLPPTALAFEPPTFEELMPFIDEEPTVIIVTPSNPGAPSVTQSTTDAGLPARAGEPAGTQAGSATTSVTGTIVYTPGNEPSTVTINGQAVVVGAVIPATSGGQVVGALTITSVAPGAIGYIFTQSDNVQHTGGNNDQIVLSLPIVVTDADGDTATGSLTITIMDDAPIARADIDSVTEDSSTVANGNVVTGALIGGSPDANASDGVADTQGADGATSPAWRSVRWLPPPATWARR